MVKQESPEPTSEPTGVSVRGNEYGNPPLGAEVDALGVHEVKGLPAWVRWIDGLATASVVVGGAACLVMMLQVVADVVARTLWNQPLAGTLEMSQHWWMVTIVFTGLGYTQLRRENIRATLITEHLSPAWRRAADLGAGTLLGGFAVAMAYYGWLAAMESLKVRETVVAADLPIWPLAFLVPFGWAVLALQSVATIYETAIGVSRESHAEELI